MNAWYFQRVLVLITAGLLCLSTSAPSTVKNQHPVCSDNANSRINQEESISSHINSSSHGSDDISVISKTQSMKDVDAISQYPHFQQNKILQMAKLNSIDSLGLGGNYK
jgi:hypothetical protein